jgi:DMSO/TMAO reductase YedYZ molybdopterin-dependent catalytic subunit
MTSVLGLALLITIPVVAFTGFLSNDAYNPRLGENAVGRHLGPLDFYLFPWPTHPSWLYALTQGTHVTIGLAAFPILLAKLWSAIPKLFEWPPLRNPAHALERLSLAFLVGAALFEFATGILDIQYAYLFRFFFTDAHYYGAWVFSAAFAFHVAIKFGTMRSALAARGVLAPLRDNLAHTRREPAEPVRSELIPVLPAAPSMSRRAMLGTVGAGSLLLLLQGAGDAIGGPVRALSVLGPRDRFGTGPNGFAVNRTALAAQIAPEDVDASWALALRGASGTVHLSRARLLALPQHTYELPIACVEGWSTTQRWTGVRVRDLAALLGMRGKLTLDTNSIEQNGVFGSGSLGSEEIADERTLLALRVNGADLSLDHGFPARIIGPALPGVHCTKWVAQMSFRQAEDR